MTDDELRRTAMCVLERELGTVEALRFLALVRREPFDYFAWRNEHLDGLSVEQLFERMQELERSA